MMKREGLEMQPQRTEFFPMDYDVQMLLVSAFERTNKKPLQLGLTVKQLCKSALADYDVSLSSSEVRKALGWFYGQGRVKVVAFIAEEEYWNVTTDDEMLQR